MPLKPRGCEPAKIGGGSRWPFGLRSALARPTHGLHPALWPAYSTPAASAVQRPTSYGPPNPAWFHSLDQREHAAGNMKARAIAALPAFLLRVPANQVLRLGRFSKCYVR